MEEATILMTQWATLFLEWVGFGTILGLLAKMILPGKDPGGTLATIVIGIVGSLVGASILFFFTGVRVSPISVGGFAVGLVATTLLLGLYRLLQGQRWTTIVTVLKTRRAPRRRTAATSSILEE